MAYVANFEGILKEEKNFGGISGMAHLLGIFSTGKYPKTKKIVGIDQAAPKNAPISLSMAQFLHTPNICDFLRNSYRTEVLTISLKESQKCFYKDKFRKIHPYLPSQPKIPTSLWKMGSKWALRGCQNRHDCPFFRFLRDKSGQIRWKSVVPNGFQRHLTKSIHLLRILAK